VRRDREPRRRRATVLALALAAATGACHVDISRVRDGQPLDLPAYEALAEGRSTLAEALARLGAPDKLEAKGGKDYLWYLHRDFTRVGVRFQSPLDIFGVRPTVADVEGSSDETDAMALVFDEKGLLEGKRLRLSESSRKALEAPAGAPPFVQLVPRYGYNAFYLGDGGEEDFEELFQHGHLAGFDVGLRLAAFFQVQIGGSYQIHDGDDFRDRGLTVSLDDLEIYQAEIGGRLFVPPEFLNSFWRLDEVRELFERPDVRAHQGAFFYLEWSVGAAYSESVKVDIDGAPRGTYFDHSLGMSSSLGWGFEYIQGRFGFHLQLVYYSIDAFEEGTVRVLDNDADEFQGVWIGGGASASF
jgi:hypothetical protein